MTAATAPAAESFLPLRPVEFQILLSLSAGERHGYAILLEAEDRGEGAAVPGLATLYRGLRRLERDGLIRPAPNDASETDDRRRPYAMTELGRAVAVLEARRLETQVRDARGTLLKETGSAR